MKKILLIILVLTMATFAGWNIGAIQNGGTDIGATQDNGATGTIDTFLVYQDTIQVWADAIAASCSLRTDSGQVVWQWTTDTTGTILRDTTEGVTGGELVNDTTDTLNPSTEYWTRFYFEADTGTVTDSTIWRAYTTQDSSDTSDWLYYEAQTPPVLANVNNASAYVCSTSLFYTNKTGGSDSNLVYQWQLSTNGGVDWGNTGTDNDSLTTPVLAIDNNNDQYRVIGTNAFGADTAGAGTLTVTYECATVSVDPDDESVYLGETATFEITASEVCSLYYQWQSNDGGWSDITGETSASYTTDAVFLADSGNWYRCVVSSPTAACDTSDSALLSVNYRVANITENPVNDTVEIGETASFFVSATGDSLDYQWQYYRSSWRDTTGTDSILTLPNIPFTMNGDSFRCIASNVHSVDTSTSALLTVLIHLKKWIGSTSTDWSVAANWDNGLPGVTDTAWFDSDASDNCVLSEAVSVKELYFDVSFDQSFDQSGEIITIADNFTGNADNTTIDAYMNVGGDLSLGASSDVTFSSTIKFTKDGAEIDLNGKSLPACTTGGTVNIDGGGTFGRLVMGTTGGDSIVYQANKRYTFTALDSVDWSGQSSLNRTYLVSDSPTNRDTLDFPGSPGKKGFSYMYIRDQVIIDTLECKTGCKSGGGNY